MAMDMNMVNDGHVCIFATAKKTEKMAKVLATATKTEKKHKRTTTTNHLCNHFGIGHKELVVNML